MQRIDRLRGHGRRRLLSALALAGGLAAFGLVWAWVAAPLRVMPPPVAIGISSDALARRAEAAFTDADAATGRAVHGAARAEFVVFRGATSSVCVTGLDGRGVFYCPESGVAAVDLGYLDALAARLRDNAELGVALVAARLAAEHRQREAGVLDSAALDMIGARKARRAEIAKGLALQADCLTGAWARSAEESLGAVPNGFWGALVQSARNVAAAFADAGHPIAPELDPFAAGTREDRAQAFARGYDAASASACPAPVTLDMP
ncbi:MAG: neutral zinc metallopeptidase [Amaricoccus sp.]|uniref:neutral zinc metallopeptidase n=1 Tax=Amaricoccus sp. TaxID=1872485 RepID=UPI0039E45094